MERVFERTKRKGETGKYRIMRLETTTEREEGNRVRLGGCRRIEDRKKVHLCTIHKIGSLEDSGLKYETRYQLGSETYSFRDFNV